MFWSQSDMNIWIASPLIRPHAITNTRTALTTGQNVDTTCLQSPLILENSSDKKKMSKGQLTQTDQSYSTRFFQTI